MSNNDRIPHFHLSVKALSPFPAADAFEQLMRQCAKKPQVRLKLANGEACFYGDPVFHGADQDEVRAKLEAQEIGEAIRAVDGFYYLLLYLEQPIPKLIVSSGPFSMLPLFSRKLPMGSISVASSLRLLLEKDQAPAIPDEQYYLEKALFNYPLFNRTPVQGIETLPTNTYLECTSEGQYIRKHTQIEDYYIAQPKPWRKSLDELSDLFIEYCIPFLPSSPFTATLTGGFDGRTAIAVALQQGKTFSTFSYGSPTDEDVLVPQRVAKTIGFPYQPLLLGCAM